MPKSNKIPSKKQEKIYLDYASATPIDSLVSLIMGKFSKENFANPSAIHGSGLKVKKVLEETRKEVGDLLGAHSDEIIFTSGATESNNLAILGIINKYSDLFTPHIVTTNIEHASVLEVCKYLEKTKKAEVTYVEVEKNGIVDPKKIRKALKINTVLVSVIYANNEIGTVQPLREIAKELRHYRKTSKGRGLVFHTDAVQAINYLSINVEKLGVDLFSFNSAKIYGPKGVGVLYIKRNTLIQKILFGGEQEFGVRPGTENVVNILGLKEALFLALKMKKKEVIRLTLLRDYFFNKLDRIDIKDSGDSKPARLSATAESLAGCKIIFNGDLKNRLPNNINITIPKIPSDLLVIELDARGVLLSAKSACKMGDNEVSYVIRAINKNILDTDGSLRFSLGRDTTKKDIIYTVKALARVLNKLKKWYD